MKVLEPDVRDDDLHYGEYFWAGFKLAGFFWMESLKPASPIWWFLTTRGILRNPNRGFRLVRRFADELETWEYSRKLCTRYNRLFGPCFDPELLPVWRNYWSLQK